MKTVMLVLASLLFVPQAPAADIQTVLQRLDSAQGQLSAAQQQIEYAKQELFQMLQQQPAGFVCNYNFNAFQAGQKQYIGRGATQDEAKENAVFDCSRDSTNPYSAHCRDWMNLNMACRQAR